VLLLCYLRCCCDAHSSGSCLALPWPFDHHLQPLSAVCVSFAPCCPLLGAFIASVMCRETGSCMCYVWAFTSPTPST
jgi:hypothetical protein